MLVFVLRREADEFIQAGVVQVNDQVVTELGTKITRQDKVLFKDQPVQIESKVYIVLNKPKNCVTTSRRSSGTSDCYGFGKERLPGTYLSGRASGP